MATKNAITTTQPPRGEKGWKQDLKAKKELKKRPRLRDALVPDAEVDERYLLRAESSAGLLLHKERQSAKGNGFGCKVPDPDGDANTLVIGGMGLERNLVEVVQGGHSQGYDITPRDGTNPSITARGGGIACGAGIVEIEGGKGLFRKLIPKECERLQGFDDDHTAHGFFDKGDEVWDGIYGRKVNGHLQTNAVKAPEAGVYPIADSKRYMACGNAVSVPVVGGVGERILESIGNVENLRPRTTHLREWAKKVVAEEYQKEGKE